MEMYHKPGTAVWQCEIEDCGAAPFDSEFSFRQRHALAHHCRRTFTYAHSARRETPPKHAFACGSSPYVTRIFDSWNEWRDNVRDHILGGAESDFWRYSVEFRNLLRQKTIDDIWNTFVKRQLGVIPTAEYSFQWERATSEQEKRYLECGNLDCGSERAVEKIFLAATRVEILVIGNGIRVIAVHPHTLKILATAYTILLSYVFRIIGYIG
jgi:hypothetical protein